MTADTEGLRRAVLAVAVDAQIRRIAPSLGADPDKLLDSRSLADSLAAADPAEPGFAGRVAGTVQAAVAADPARFGAVAVPAGPAAAVPFRPPQGLWTDADVLAADPVEVSAALTNGQLSGLGIGMRRPPRLPAEDPSVWPSSGEIRRRRMTPARQGRRRRAAQFAAAARDTGSRSGGAS